MRERNSNVFTEVIDNDKKHRKMPSYKSEARGLERPVDRLVYWINERKKIKEAKAKGKPYPWTTDPILRDFKFCNVHREDDRVTQWIADNWRNPHYKSEDMWFAMGVARLINWPPTLEDIHWPVPWRPNRTRNRMNRRREAREQVFTGAYMITNAGQTMSKVDTVVFMLDNLSRLNDPPVRGDTLESAHAKLTAGDHCGMGSFMAAQVIADCKYTELLANATDWWDWCAPGPGSQRGLSRLLGVDFRRFRKDVFIEHLIQLRKEIKRSIDTELHLQDLQNCLCEFDKFERTLWGEGRPRSRYTPTGPQRHLEF